MLIVEKPQRIHNWPYQLALVTRRGLCLMLQTHINFVIQENGRNIHFRVRGLKWQRSALSGTSWLLHTYTQKEFIDYKLCLLC